MRSIKRLLILFGIAAVLWFAAHAYARYRVASAFADAGLSDGAAACMGRRLDERFTLLQLRKLEALREESATLPGLMRAVRRIDDGRVVRVTAGSLALCSTGLAR